MYKGVSQANTVTQPQKNVLIVLHLVQAVIKMQLLVFLASQANFSTTVSAQPHAL